MTNLAPEMLATFSSHHAMPLPLNTPLPGPPDLHFKVQTLTTNTPQCMYLYMHVVQFV